MLLRISGVGSVVESILFANRLQFNGNNTGTSQERSEISRKSPQSSRILGKFGGKEIDNPWYRQGFLELIDGKHFLMTNCFFALGMGASVRAVWVRMSTPQRQFASRVAVLSIGGWFGYRIIAPMTSPVIVDNADRKRKHWALATSLYQKLGKVSLSNAPIDKGLNMSTRDY
mmetsp:Transcript_13294/g.19883  ORF Transcript_13294/g.19883 Transcript_13294/m.19883 type:complete len:172 (+) Transcript_13294:57-572(+)